MKIFIQVLFLLVAFASVSFGAVQRGIFQDDKHPGKCAISDSLILSPQEKAPHPEICGIYICESESGLAQILSCGSQGAAPGCVLGDAINPGASYPDCCEKKEIC